MHGAGHSAAAAGSPVEPHRVGGDRQLDAGLPPGPRRHARRQDLPLRARATRAVPPRAGAIHHAAAADRRPLRQPVLHDLLTADAPAPARDHGEAPARRPGVELAARRDGAREAHLGGGSLRRVLDRPQACRRSTSSSPGERDHPRHVHDAHPVRPRARTPTSCSCTAHARRPTSSSAASSRRSRARCPPSASSTCASGTRPGSRGEDCAASSAARCCSCWHPTWRSASCSAAGLRLHGRRPPHAR